MRAQATLIIAPYIGQILTQELASRIVAQFPSAGVPIDLTQFEPAHCGTLTFQAERLLDIQKEMHELHQLHWLETEGYRHGLELDMDYDAMVLDEQEGRLIQFTARAGKQLAGNFRLYLGRSRHTGTRFAKEDTLYLLPHHRIGRNALRLLEYAKKCLMALGYREFRADVKTPAAGRLLEHCGFKPVSTNLVLIEE